MHTCIYICRLQRYAILGGAAMQKDAEAPVQNLLPLHLCS
jgi:hypothetical protein